MRRKCMCSPIRCRRTWWFHHRAIRLHYGEQSTLWRMQEPCVGLWPPMHVCPRLSACECVRTRASSHYLLLPAPGDSAPSLHLSSWLATICLSTSSSLVSRSNWSSCKQTHKVQKYTLVSQRRPDVLLTVIQEWEADSFASQCRLAMTHKRSDSCCK